MIWFFLIERCWPAYHIIISMPLKMKHLAAWDKIQCFHFHFKISASRRTCFRFVLGHAVCQSLLPFDQRCNNQRRWSTLLRLQARESANLSCLGYDCRLPPGKYCGIVESLVSWKFWNSPSDYTFPPCFFLPGSRWEPSKVCLTGTLHQTNIAPKIGGFQ